AVLICTRPHRVARGNRMLSSSTPVIVCRGGRPVLVAGSPGGRTIINTVLEVVVNFVDHRMAVQDAVDAPRFHHQWLPDKVVAEPLCFSPHARGALEAMGHAIETPRSGQGPALA